MKDTRDRSDEPLPVRRSQIPPPAPVVEVYDDYQDASQSAQSGKKISVGLLFRALKRHWWQAMILWTLGSAGLMALAYYKVKPTYDAIAQVRIDLDKDSVFRDSSAASIDSGIFIGTQVSLITSPNVVGTALSKKPELVNLPFLKGVADPEIELSKALRVGPVPRTHLIQVELSSQIPTEAAELVNAVVDEYVSQAHSTYDVTTVKRIAQLKQLRDEHKKELEDQRKVVQDLADKIGLAGVEAVKDRGMVSIDSYRALSEELTRVEIMGVSAKGKLAQLQGEKVLPTRALTEESIKEAITEAFLSDPDVLRLQSEIEAATKKLKDVEHLTRKSSDPSRQRVVSRLEELKATWEDLWRKKEPRLRRLVTTVPIDDSVERAIKEAELNLTSIATQEETLRTKLKELKIMSKSAESDSLKLEYAQEDMANSKKVYDTVANSLNQLEFEAKSPNARVNLQFPAKATTRPDSNRRLQIMAAAPIVTGLFVMGLFLLVELRGARVANPEDLVGRLHLPVIGVVPPLPQIRANTGANVGGAGGGDLDGPPMTQSEFRARRELDEFVQSLDHLRVALCANKDAWGRDKHCVLITSAIGSEGKTTLAAQLAERCVNAGMMTLLIDGDLRNPTLSRMLDAAENPGLINILRGEMTAEEVVMVIGDAGGFHLLPAGTPRVDPSRLLRSERLGELIAQARESFDMIIIDAPPVLPVPDALTIGRWVDGAVLAVRYDTSRFPLVERANRRLAHVGVPVIGAVVNGVRSMESAYGGYYSYGSYGDTPSASKS